MRCPRCGNEIHQEEVFCGQCGMPNTAQASPPNVMNNPLPLSGNGLLGAYGGNATFTPPQADLRTQVQMPPNVYTSPQTNNVSMPPHLTNLSNPDQSSLELDNSYQQREFYQNATEAMPPSSLNPAQGYSTGYQSPRSPGTHTPKNYAPSNQNRSSMYPAHAGNYGRSGYLQPPLTNQHYNNGTHLRPTPPPQKQQNSGVLLVASIFCIIALISLVSIATFFLTRNQAKTTSPLAIATTTIAPTPTPIPTMAPTPIPSPTAVPTPPPDAGFAWCGPACTNQGFTMEYPGTWPIGVPANANGVQFTNPAQPDQYVALKAIGPTTSSASDLVNADLQANFATKPGYVPPTASAISTISGETWIDATAHYQISATQQERTIVYATVHQGKAYIIELQAAEPQFDALNTQYFINMLGKFQFN